MAKVKKTILGKVSGALGDLVFRIRNGKSFVSTRPVGSRTKNAAAIERQKKFALAGRLALSITSVDMLKYFWMKAAPANLSAGNFIVKLNYPSVTEKDINDRIYMMPSIGFSINPDSVLIQPERVRLSFNPIGTATDIDVEREVKIACAGIMFLNEAAHPNESPYVFISLRSELVTLQLENPLLFDINFTDIQKQHSDMYANAKGFFTLVTFDSDDNPVRYSNTVFGVKE